MYEAKNLIYPEFAKFVSPVRHDQENFSDFCVIRIIFGEMPGLISLLVPFNKT